MTRESGRHTRVDFALGIAAGAIVGVLAALLIFPSLQSPEPVVATDAAASPAPERPTALFIGDSYTSSNGESGVRPYPCDVSADVGWNCVVSGLPGTGFVLGGENTRFPLLGSPTGISESAVERIPLLHSRIDPDFVIFDSGRNDVLVNPDDLRSAILKTLSDTRMAWPNAKIVLVRPWILKRPADEVGLDSAFWETLLAEPSAAGVVFIDPQRSRWLDGTAPSTLLADDAEHPNDRGVAAIAVELEKSLKQSGVVR